MTLESVKTSFSSSLTEVGLFTEPLLIPGQRGGRTTEDRGMLGHARGQDNARTVLGHVLTLSYVIKRSHDKLKRGKNV